MNLQPRNMPLRGIEPMALGCALSPAGQGCGPSFNWCLRSGKHTDGKAWALVGKAERHSRTVTCLALTLRGSRLSSSALHAFSGRFPGVSEVNLCGLNPWKQTFKTHRDPLGTPLHAPSTLSVRVPPGDAAVARLLGGRTPALGAPSHSHSPPAGEGAGGPGAQLQPPGLGPGEDFPDLLGAGGAPGCAPQALASQLLNSHQPLPAPARTLRGGAHHSLLLGKRPPDPAGRPRPGLPPRSPCACGILWGTVDVPGGCVQLSAPSGDRWPERCLGGSPNRGGGRGSSLPRRLGGQLIPPSCRSVGQKEARQPPCPPRCPQPWGWSRAETWRQGGDMTLDKGSPWAGGKPGLDGAPQPLLSLQAVPHLPPGPQILEGGCREGSQVQQLSGSKQRAAPPGTSPPCPSTGLPACALPPRPHAGPGRAAGRDAGRPAVPLCLGDGLLPHHALQPPCQVRGRGQPVALEGRPALPTAAPGKSRLRPGPFGRGPVGPRTLTFGSPRYWPVLDDALREAAFSRHVQVRLLVSCSLYTDPSMFPHLRSLQAFSDPAANVSMDVVRPVPSGWEWTASLPPPLPSPSPSPSSPPQHAPSLSVPKESLHRACGESLQHPVQQNEPRQVHGHREGSLYR